MRASITTLHLWGSDRGWEATAVELRTEPRFPIIIRLIANPGARSAAVIDQRLCCSGVELLAPS